MKFLPFILLFFYLNSVAQSASITEIDLNSEKFADASFPIRYPVINLGDKTATDKINSIIKAQLLDENLFDTVITATLPALKQYSKESLLGMEYKVLFNKNGILSLQVDCDAQGIYEYHYYRYFNFDLSTGQQLTLGDIIAPLRYALFKKIMFGKKLNALQEYRHEMKVEADSNFISAEEYNTCLNILKENGCADSITLNEFSLEKGIIQVYDNCFFPHSMMAERPFYELKYTVRKDDEMIKKDFLLRLTP
ncbi:MAG TPA: hypothetical protein VG738_06650 [Chitinophagaceae bacterium]|nr:hypothetical protein [Chitinophagaceae bacterium]